jgi:hypothetical protein
MSNPHILASGPHIRTCLMDGFAFKLWIVCFSIMVVMILYDAIAGLFRR